MRTRSVARRPARPYLSLARQRQPAVPAQPRLLLARRSTSIAPPRRRGMDIVTITDHDSIDGCLELLDAHPDAPDILIGEEVSCRLPDGNIEVHLGVYGIDRALHREIAAAARETSSSDRAACGEPGRSSRSIICCISIRGQRAAARLPAAAVARSRRSKCATGRCCARTTRWSTDARAARHRAAPARRSSPAATRTRCAGSAGRGPRRPGRNRDEFLASLRAGAGASRRARTARTAPSPATPTASSRATPRASSAAARAIIAGWHRAACAAFIVASLPVAVPAAGRCD